MDDVVGIISKINNSTATSEKKKSSSLSWRLGDILLGKIKAK